MGKTRRGVDSPIRSLLTLSDQQPTRDVARLTTSPVATDNTGRRADVYPVWVSLRLPTALEKGAEAVVALKSRFATRTSAVGLRVTKPPWGWLFSTATNSVR